MENNTVMAYLVIVSFFHIPFELSVIRGRCYRCKLNAGHSEEEMAQSPMQYYLPIQNVSQI